MTEITPAILEKWLRQLMKEPERCGYQKVYAEGWIGALYAVMARMDDWKRGHILSDE